MTDVTLILEGTYPYVAGGVSSWVHQLLHAYPERTFSLLHIGPQPGAYEEPLYELPDNVLSLEEIHCRGQERVHRRWSQRTVETRRAGERSRVLAAIRRLHIEDRVDDELLDDLAAGDLSIAEFLHGDAVFDLLRGELYELLSPEFPFMDFFWHFRAMHIPLLRLLEARCPEASVYHAVSTGYAGLVGAIASWRQRRPLVITEHGIYAREREIELSRATWIRDRIGIPGAATPSPLRRFWSHYFKMLSRIAYHRATRLITLSESNRNHQLADGADLLKTAVVPNGVHHELFPRSSRASSSGDPGPMRVGFVGRVVPIKDVITLIRACSLALDQVDLEVWIIGPEDEDRTYARRCRSLVEMMGIEDHIRFLGPQPMADMYPQLDVVLLTSISEGQPLVILEAYAAGVPVVATDVGACRELIEGCVGGDAAIGPSGIVTRVANPTETAAALVFLAKNRDVREAMGRSGHQRVTARYRQQQVEEQYDSLYTSMETWQESAGNLNA
jgi:glycosyltransferase involved in cell wall biosynthesis